jgi:hypothetical protein
MCFWNAPNVKTAANHLVMLISSLYAILVTHTPVTKRRTVSKGSVAIFSDRHESENAQQKNFGH